MRVFRSRRGMTGPPTGPFEINLDSPQANGLVAWWPFQWGAGIQTGTVKDLGLRGIYNLSQINTPTWTTDVERGWTMLFDDAASEYLTDSSVAAVTAPAFSVTARANFDDLGGDTIMAIAGLGSNIVFQQGVHMLTMHTNDDTIRAYSQDDAGALFPFAASTASVTVDTWHHCAGVWAATNDRRAFLDGGNKGTENTNIANTVDTTEIASWSIAAGRAFYLSGRLSDVRIYNRALADAEVTEHAHLPWDLYRPLQRRWAVEAPAVGGQPMMLRGTTVPHIGRQWHPRVA